jgi:LemA protein
MRSSLLRRVLKLLVFGQPLGSRVVPWRHLPPLGSRLHPAIAAARRPSRWRFLATRRAITILTGSTLVCLLVGGGIYYYNLLVRRFADTEAATAKVDTLLQRRHDLTLSLQQAVIASRRHEASVVADVAAKRTQLGATGAAQGSSPAPLIGLAPSERILAIAEQYPGLRLAENYHTLMQALVDVEKDLAGARLQAVDTADLYYRQLHTFPSSLCAKLFGFGEIPFYRAAAEARDLAKAEY